MKDLFVSYCNDDIIKVKSVVRALKFYGAECWFQDSDSNQEFPEAIIKGFEESSNFVVFLSNSSIKSMYVLNEIKIAISKHQKESSFHIVPVIIGDCDIDSYDFMKINVMIGSFNFLFEKKFENEYDLALKILDQANIENNLTDSVNSIYDGATDIEKERLASQNRFLNRISKGYFDEIFDNLHSPYVLDVGCSDGSNVVNRLSGRDYSQLVGIDNNVVDLQSAIDNLQDDKHRFFNVDITADDLEEQMQSILQETGIKQFDLIQFSAVLMHTKNPEQILATMRKFLSKGGYIFIQEEDDGVNLAYPNSDFFDSCFYLYMHSKESGDRHMARKIPSLLKNSGYSDVSLKSTSISSIDFGGEEKETLWDMYFNPTYWNASDAKFFDNIKAVDALQNAKRLHDDKKSAYMRDEIFVMLGVFFFTARNL